MKVLFYQVLFHHLMNLVLWMLVQWTSKMCPFYIKKKTWGYIYTLKLLRRRVQERLRRAWISRLAKQPSSYGILTDHNAGTNVERAGVRKMAATICSIVSYPAPTWPGNFFEMYFSLAFNFLLSSMFQFFYQLTGDEMQKLIDAFKDPPRTRQEGIYFHDRHYKCVRADKNSIYAKCVSVAIYYSNPGFDSCGHQNPPPPKKSKNNKQTKTYKQ